MLEPHDSPEQKQLSVKWMEKQEGAYAYDGLSFRKGILMQALTRMTIGDLRRSGMSQ